MTEEYINKGLVEQLDTEIEYVDPTEGPFTLEDLEINKKDIEAFLKRQKDAPKGLASKMLTDMANPFFTLYGEPKTLTGLATKSSLEAIKDQLIHQAIRIQEQKKISKKASKAPSYLSLMSPKNVINEANNITKGFVEPVGMGEGPITPVDKKTDPRTLTGPITYLDYLKSVTPFTDEIQKVRYETGSLLSMMPAAEITVGAPGGSVASGFNLRGLASFGNEILTQKVIAKAKKMSTKQGAEFIDEFIKSKNINVNKLPQTDKVAKTIDNRTDFQTDGLFINMGDEGALLEYEDIGANLNEYMIRNDRNALLQAFNSPNYDMYNEVLQANLKRAFPSGKINVERIENYVAGGEGAGLIITPKDKRIITYDRIDISDVKFVGGAEEREVVLLGSPRANEEGGMVGNQQLLSYMISKNQPDNFMKVDDLGVKEELAKLEILPTEGADVTQTNVAAYMSTYSEGFGHNATETEKKTNSFRIMNSESSVGYKAKNVDTPFSSGSIGYNHPEVLEREGDFGKAQYEPVYGHSRSLQIRELGENDVHPSLKGTAVKLTTNSSFKTLDKYRTDYEFYQKSNMNDSNKPPIVYDKNGNEFEITGPKDIDINNYGIEDKNLIEIFPNIELPRGVKIDGKEIDEKFSLLLDFRISMQKLRAILGQFTEIPKLSIVKNPKLTKAKLDDADYYKFEDVMMLLRNTTEMVEIKELENHIHNYAKLAIVNSLEPNVMKAEQLYEAIQPLNIFPGIRPSEFSKDLNKILMEPINFENPVPHREIHNLVATLAKIEAQRAVVKNKDTKVNILEEAGKLLAKDETSDALINLLKHEELGGENLLSLYKQANTKPDRMAQPQTTPGGIIGIGDIRDKIQEAEKNWGTGKTILRFAEEQYDTFKPNKGFSDSENMMKRMKSIKGATEEFDAYLKDRPMVEPELGIASKAFARMMDKPEQLVELTTLHNLKKAVEGGFDKVQFNTFTTQAKLSDWVDFRGRPEDLEKYYSSPLENATANDISLFKLLNFSKDNKLLKDMQQQTSQYFLRSIGFSTRPFLAPKGMLTSIENIEQYMKLNKDYDLDRKISQTLRDIPQETRDKMNKTILKALPYLDDSSFLARSGLIDIDEYNMIVQNNTGQYGTAFGRLIKDDAKKLLEEDNMLVDKLFSDQSNKAVYKDYEGRFKRFIRKIAESGKERKEITTPLWTTTVKRALLDLFFMLPKTENPMSFVEKLSENIFYNKYGMPSDKALADGIVGAKNDKGELRYPRLRDQYDKNKMKALEKMGLSYKIVRDGKPSSPMTFIEVNLGNTKKEKLELLEKLNNYEVKLYSSMNPIPSFNEVKEEEREDPMALEST
tara:strand:- start:798 stop:4805 length:4008 start_codon:yes stop_codon:yes gene_type:complete